MNPLSAAVQKQLSLLAKKECLPHAWLFSGCRHLSVAAAAEYFSALLIESALPHPDVHGYLPEGKLRLHPIHQIHELVQELFLPPYQAKRKVFIIYEADLMLPASANALLKGLEEPPVASFLLLTTCQEERILPTIRSRCGKFCVGDVSLPSVDEALQSLVREMCTSHLSGDWVGCRRSWEKAGDFVSTEEEGEDPVKAKQILEQLFLWYRDCFLLSVVGPSAPLTFAEDLVYLLQYPVYKPVPPLGVVRRWVEEAMTGVQRSTRLARCLETFFLKCDAHL